MAVAQQPKLFTMRARGEWKGGVRTEVRVRHFVPIVLDEPADLGGSDQGPNPMEYVLSSLIGCASVMLAVVAKEQGLQYSGVEFDVRGTLDVRGLEGVEGVRPYFDTVKGSIRVHTQAAQPVLDAVAAQVERRCPVYTMLQAAGVDVQIEWVATGEA
ncbi:OsmC family protein [Carboxydochorda subterranea]|uniref:OsmC family protein n=1 Tax=Carboxydichorda subterranea TaxID=3109565 RepID=A0ABZ1BWJ9_9FIRM|nr:OsmC family protein [Limnochorda sp. L945t]WRP16835.1 OsmC family protein [Limnochorda sp. L945t]